MGERRWSCCLSRWSSSPGSQSPLRKRTAEVGAFSLSLSAAFARFASRTPASLFTGNSAGCEPFTGFQFTFWSRLALTSEPRSSSPLRKMSVSLPSAIALSAAARRCGNSIARTALIGSVMSPAKEVRTLSCPSRKPSAVTSNSPRCASQMRATEPAGGSPAAARFSRMKSGSLRGISLPEKLTESAVIASSAPACLSSLGSGFMAGSTVSPFTIGRPVSFGGLMAWS